MSDAWLRRFVVLAIVLLVVYHVGAWAYSLFGLIGGMASAALVAAVSTFAARMAGLPRGSHAWFLAPTLLFTLLPLAANSWTFITADKSWWNRAIDFVPFLIGFPAPVLLLLVVYVDLRTRASSW
ncbi:MAG: hypothetical protein ACT4P3_01630 [Betaproteobacteria bacterium]